MTSCRVCSYGNRKRSRIDEKRTVANKEEKREGQREEWKQTEQKYGEGRK